MTQTISGGIETSEAITASTIDSTPIGATTPASGAFTTLSVSGTVTGTGFAARLASPGPIGATTASTGAFTTLSAAATVSGTGFTNYMTSTFGAPPPLGGTTPNTGAFTTLSISGVATGSTPTVGDNTTKLATTAFVASAIAGGGSFVASNVAITGGTINGTSVGATTASTGAFTTLSASGTVSGAGFASLHAAPGPIGATTPSTGAFTTLSATGTVSGTGFTTLLTPYALLASPTFTGIPSAPTATAGTNTTQIATTAFVASAIAANYYNPSAVIITGGSINNTTIGATTASTGAFTTLSASGTVSGAGFTPFFASPPAIGTTTPAAGVFTTLQATSTVSGVGFTNLVAPYALIASPTFTGIPSAPTATAGTNTTQIATTAFVVARYNPAGVAITGGTIDSTSIGATTASTGAFTTLTSGTYTKTGATVESFRVFTTTGNVVAIATDRYILINKTTPAITTITLPSSPVAGRVITVKDMSGTAASFILTIVPATGTIDGSASIIINSNYGFVDLLYNGNNWSTV